ncbi:MAG: DegV family protein [Firmicutes bacterium]|nr:DegV family protein [Bacillota bacterium]
MIRDKYHVKDIIYNMIGPIIGANSGPGTIAVFFMGKYR